MVTKRSRRLTFDGTTKLVELTRPSIVDYIGQRKLDDVRVMDAASFDKLLEGSVALGYDDIARRMDEFVDFAEAKAGGLIAVNNGNLSLVNQKEFGNAVDRLHEEYSKMYNSEEAARRVGAMLNHYTAETFPETHIDDKVAVLHATHVDKECPFEGCDFKWPIEVEVYSMAYAIPLLVSRGTAHLAKEHQLLKKSNGGPNGGAITPWLFYHAFMQPVNSNSEQKKREVGK